MDLLACVIFRGVHICVQSAILKIPAPAVVGPPVQLGGIAVDDRLD